MIMMWANINSRKYILMLSMQIKPPTLLVTSALCSHVVLGAKTAPGASL